MDGNLQLSISVEFQDYPLWLWCCLRELVNQNYNHCLFLHDRKLFCVLSVHYYIWHSLTDIGIGFLSYNHFVLILILFWKDKIDVSVYCYFRACYIILQISIHKQGAGRDVFIFDFALLENSAYMHSIFTKSWSRTNTKTLYYFR
jgi:hypothetical protein